MWGTAPSWQSDSVQVSKTQSNTRTVSGVVTDTKGEAVIGAGVFVEDSDNGTVTDIDGRFTLTGVKPGNLLKASAIGYKDKETVYTGGRIVFALEEESLALDEAVVVGYGVQKKGTITGSISSMNRKELERAPTDNVVNMLGGKLPGLVTRQTSGLPGENEAQYYIRGISTTGTSTPLVLVDGVERSFSNLDPSEIADITILKDAASAAVYGVKGANGVILVTTRRGDVGKTSVSYNGAASFYSNAEMLDLLDGPEYAYWHNLATDLDGLAREYSDQQIEYIKNGGDPQGVFSNTDYLSLIFKKYALGQNHNVTVTGGNASVRYFVGGSVLDQDGIIDNVWFKRYNLRSNIDINLSDEFTLKFDISGRKEDRHQNGVSAGSSDPTASTDNGGADMGYKNIVFYAISARPTTSPFLPDGSYTGYMNPLVARDQSGFKESDNSYAQSSVSLEYNSSRIKGLTAKLMGSYDIRNTQSKHLLTPCTVYTPQYGSSNGNGGVIITEVNSPHLSSGISTLTESHTLYSSYTFSAQVNWARTFGRNDVSADLVWEQNGTSSKTFSAGKQKFAITEIPDLNFGSEVTPNSVIGYHSNTGRQGLLFRGNWTCDQKYIFQASVRGDWSAKFAAGHRLGIFPALSAGWRISEESFMEDCHEWLENLKLRASWGILGNDAISDFLYVQGVGLSSNPDVVIGGVPLQSLYTTSIPNPDITWEKTTTWNTGADVSLWQGLLGLEADVFYKVTKDILQSQAGQQPPSIGGNYASIVNRGVVDVKGFELTLSHRNRIGDLTYSASGNISYARNRYISTNDSENIPTWQRKVGRPLGEVLGYVSDGLYQTEDELKYCPKTSDAVRLGDIKYKDLNGDGKITSEDRTWIAGSQIPRIMYGINLDATWKGLSLSLFFQGAAKTDIMLCGTYTALGYSDGTYYTQAFKWGSNPPSYLVEGSWRPDHTDASYPRLSTASSTNNALASDFWKRDASYLRLKNMQLTYTLPASFSGRIGFQAIRVNLSFTNLFTVSALSKLGIDPETPSVNNGYYPQQRVMSIGLNLTI